MRGQRPAVSGLVLWVALVVMMLGALPMVTASSAAEGPATVQSREGDERGGELALHEQAPAKLRRTTLHVPAPIESTQLGARLSAASCCAALLLPATRPSLQPNDWLALKASPPTSDAPGRRQQRGQAPPQA